MLTLSRCSVLLVQKKFGRKKKKTFLNFEIIKLLEQRIVAFSKIIQNWILLKKINIFNTVIQLVLNLMKINLNKLSKLFRGLLLNLCWSSYLEHLQQLTAKKNKTFSHNKNLPCIFPKLNVTNKTKKRFSLSEW